MEDKINAKITKIGSLARNLLENNYLVIFESNEDEFSTFGYTVDNPVLNGEIKVGDVVYIDEEPFKIIEVPENFNDYLKNEFQFEMIIDREFDCENQVLLEGEKFPQIKEGTTIKIKEN